MNTSIYITIMLVCLVCSGFFSATETAFLSLNMTRIRTMAENGNRRAKLVCELEAKYDKLISPLLIGNNIVNIGLASLGTVVFVHLCGDDLGASISTAVCTVAVLIFGEITPKGLAKDFPERFAMFAAPAVNAIMKVLTPLNYIFSKWKQLVGSIIKTKNDSKMSQEELLMFVEEVQADGSINETERDLLRNAIEFTERRAIDILTHRVDLEAISLDTSGEEIAERFSRSKYSRLLVYSGTIDNIVGVVHQKDFYSGTGITDKSLGEILTPPLFIPKSGKISEILKSLQKSKSHVAVILDEYGGTLGIVTMEDILEELVGEIWDEHDELTEHFHKIDEGRYRIDSALDYEDFARFFGLEEEEDVFSINGWLAKHLGHMPEHGELAVLDGLEIRILEREAHRVTVIEVSDKRNGDEMN